MRQQILTDLARVIYWFYPALQPWDINASELCAPRRPSLKPSLRQDNQGQRVESDPNGA